MKEQIAYFNGIHADTGEYYTKPAALQNLATRIVDNLGDQRHLVYLRNFLEQWKKPKLGPVFGVNPQRLDEAGWGIIFHRDEAEAVRKSLSDLISHRNGKILEYIPTESKDQWLRRHGISPGSVDPKRVPYYLLIVGEPALIPFEFQYQLDIQFAVGRISLDTAQDYENYSQSVIAHEQSAAARFSEKFTVFGTVHNGDRATELSSKYLAGSICENVPKLTGRVCNPCIGEAATKENLLKVFTDSSTERASLVFVACHGIGYNSGDARQLNGQGAWLCQDWPGSGLPKREHFFTAEDVPADSNLGGKVVFSFSCFGAGTPLFDDFDGKGSKLAPKAFISALPKKLLAHPAGGILAFIGHIDRAWGYSFLWDGIGSQPQNLISTLCHVLTGTRLGHATTDINVRYAELSTMLVDALHSVDSQQTIHAGFLEQAQLWVARNDARNYVILGDPAVQL